jgi:hypothetical protein
LTNKQLTNRYLPNRHLGGEKNTFGKRRLAKDIWQKTLAKNIWQRTFGKIIWLKTYDQEVLGQLTFRHKLKSKDI